jgi:predicted membrane protein
MKNDKDGIRRNNEEPETNNTRHQAHRGSMGRALFGVGVLILGTILTLDNLEILEGENYWDFWPVLLILLGASHLFAPESSRRVGWGVLWSIVGIALLLNNFDMIRFNIWELWPMALIFVGGNILWQVFGRGRRRSSLNDSSEFDIMAAMSGVSRRINSKNFTGGSATAVMGGCELDLRDATIQDGPVEIQIFSFWGGIEIRVPQEWDVRVKGTAIMGAYEDKTAGIGDGSQVLIVTGTIFMAGVEIRN